MTPDTPQPQGTEAPLARIGGKRAKGVSGNPGGRPKVIAEIAELAREHSPAALSALVAIATNPDEPAAARVAAAVALLDRGYGKPRQAFDLDVRAEQGPNPLEALIETDQTAREHAMALAQLAIDALALPP